MLGLFLKVVFAAVPAEAVQATARDVDLGVFGKSGIITEPVRYFNPSFKEGLQS